MMMMMEVVVVVIIHSHCLFVCLIGRLWNIVYHSFIHSGSLLLLLLLTGFSSIQWNKMNEWIVVIFLVVSTRIAIIIMDFRSYRKGMTIVCVCVNVINIGSNQIKAYVLYARLTLFVVVVGELVFVNSFSFSSPSLCFCSFDSMVSFSVIINPAPKLNWNELMIEWNRNPFD